MLNSDGQKYLCRGCSKYDLCTLRYTDIDLEYCEEYEAKNKLIINDYPNSQNNLSNSIIKNNNIVKPRGICRNCANLETCLYPRPEEGVWRCEEYE